ncbi:MAG: restriction endonuclease subunit S, partial [Pirellulaceae bacterium]
MQVADGYKQTEVGVIPEDWEVQPIHTLADKIMVGIASAATHAYRNRGVVMFRNQNIKPGYLDDSDILFIDEAYEETYRNKRLKAGDLLTARTGYPGTTAIVPRKYEGSQSFTTLITRPRLGAVDPEYLCCFINSEAGQSFFDQHQTGGGQKNVNAGILKQLPIALPPIAEQRAIAEALSDVDALIGSLDALITKKRQIKQGTMQQLLTGKTRLPGFSGEWETCCQGDVVTFINGRAYGKHEWQSSGTPVCRLQNLTGSGDTFYYSNLKLPEKQYMESGDLIFMWSASFGPYIWQGPRAIYHYHIWKIECDPDLVDRRFYYHKLVELTEHLKATTDGSTMLHLTKGGMEKFQVPIPPVLEQTAI